MGIALTASADSGRHGSHPHAHIRPNKVATLKPIAETTTLSAGDGAIYMRIPSWMNKMRLCAVEACVYTASSSGAITIMIHNVTQAADLLTTALTIDANELDSSTAATPVVIDTSGAYMSEVNRVATGDQLRVDVDGAGTGTKGIEVNLGFRRG